MTNFEPIRIIFEPGRTLRLRAVDRNGFALAKASFLFDSLHAGRGQPGESQRIVHQVEFSGVTDQTGELLWKTAPTGELFFSAFAKDCMELRDAKVAADETEHTFTMSPALTVHGTVRDAATGEKIQ